MGRGKVEVKRIEDKGKREFSFLNRRNGILKKANELAFLCDVDVALLVFSETNRLHEYSTDESMNKILTRYQNFKIADEIVRRSVRENLTSNVSTAEEQAQLIERHIEEQNVQQSGITKLCQLEEEIMSVLQLVRTKKNQVMQGAGKTLLEKNKQLIKDMQIIGTEMHLS